MRRHPLMQRGSSLFIEARPFVNAKYLSTSIAREVVEAHRSCPPDQRRRLNQRSAAQTPVWRLVRNRATWTERERRRPHFFFTLNRAGES